MGSKTREGNSYSLYSLVTEFKTVWILKTYFGSNFLLGLGLSKIFFASLKQIFHSDFSQVAFPLVVA